MASCRWTSTPEIEADIVDPWGILALTACARTAKWKHVFGVVIISAVFLVAHSGCKGMRLFLGAVNS